MASAATPPIASVSGRMTTSIYLLAVKRVAPEAMSAPASHGVDGNHVAGFAFVHDHHGHDRIEPGRLDRRHVVGDDDLTRGDVVTLADVGGEARAAQRHGVQSEVHQDAHVVRRHDDVGMREQLQHLAADRRDGVDDPAGRVDRGAVADHALGEHRDRAHPRAQRRAPRRGRGRASGSLSTPWSGVWNMFPTSIEARMRPSRSHFLV